MSGEYYLLLWRRAERFLLRAERDLNEGDYDGACFNSEEALQLAVKAVLYRYFGESLRIHGSRILLARLRNLLMEAGMESEASIISEFVSNNRVPLGILEESYIMARYGNITYEKSQAELCVKTAKKAFEVLRDIERGLG